MATLDIGFFLRNTRVELGHRPQMGAQYVDCSLQIFADMRIREEPTFRFAVRNSTS